MLARLEPYKEKLCKIGNASGESGFRPLAPQIRSNWILNLYTIPEPVKAQETAQPKPKVKRKSKSQKLKAANTDNPGKNEETVQPEAPLNEEPQKETAK